MEKNFCIETKTKTYHAIAFLEPTRDAVTNYIEKLTQPGSDTEKEQLNYAIEQIMEQFAKIGDDDSVILAQSAKNATISLSIVFVGKAYPANRFS